MALRASRIVLAALIVGCGPRGEDQLAGSRGAQPPGTASADGAVVTTKSGLPCDVDGVLKAKCQTCHGASPSFGAPNALVTWDDLKKPGVLEAVTARIHDTARPMPPSPQAALDPSALAIVDGWIAAGAKPSETACTGEAAPSAIKPLSCTPDTVLKSPTPYTMAANPPTDQYVCYGVDIDLPAKRHVTALAPHVDNKDIVHHILLFQTDDAVSTEPKACAAFGSAGWKLVAGWAPGGTNIELPGEAGFPEEQGTTHWVVQVHYNSSKVKAGADNSGFELCTTDQLRPNDAGVLGFGSTSFSIPPRSSKKIACDYKLGSEFKDQKLVKASPHMHTLGTALSIERLAGGTGAPEPVYAQNAFSFEAQGNYPVSQSITSGDVMRTHCSWKNPGDATVKFGEGTGDEMCFMFMMYYPAIPDRTVLGYPLFTWVTPSYKADCVDESD